MPELPEVEVARRHLEAWTRDKTILRARVPKSRVLGKQSPRKVSTFLAGRTVEAVDRKGKSMLVRLSEEGALHLHLGMTGQIVRAEEESVNHVRLELELDDHSRVQFDDSRMFGRVAVGPWRELTKKYFVPLGPDPLRRELTPRRLSEILLRSRRPIKTVLMDQAMIAGVGNIYAAEALWIARIDPLLPANRIDLKRCELLLRAIKKTMRAAIVRLEGGEKYLSQGGDNHFQVYGREGEPCLRCKRKLERYDLGGRSTYWCKRCQS